MLTSLLRSEQFVHHVPNDMLVARALKQRQNGSDLSRLQGSYNCVDRRVGFQLRFRQETHIAVAGRCVWLFRKIHGKRSKIFAALKPVMQGLDFLLRLSIALRLAVLQIGGRLLGVRGDNNFGQMILRLN